MKRLIVTADDFGLTRSINEGIVKACREGIVTNINVLPSGGAFGDAVRLLQELKPKDIGAHLSLTETDAVSDPGKIPALVTRGSRFHKDHNLFFMKFKLGMIHRHDICTELERQLRMAESIGIPISNLSSHEHIHMMPKLFDIFVALAKEHGIPALRMPADDTYAAGLSPAKIAKRMIVACFAPGMERRLRAGGIRYAEHFAGFLDSGRLREEALLGILASLKDGTTELVTHPGFIGPEVISRYRFHLNSEYELYALTGKRAKDALKTEGIKLSTYGEFVSGTGA
ncbi:MAG: ChbG/HpnK family deacetylase [Candidatus Omnitrophota bacterium]